MKIAGLPPAPAGAPPLGGTGAGADCCGPRRRGSATRWATRRRVSRKIPVHPPGLNSSNESANPARLPAHPPEPGYPCVVSALGELAWMAPRGEPSVILSRLTELVDPRGQ